MIIENIKKSSFQKWQGGIDAATKDARWSMWDCTIQTTVNDYNHHLFGTSGFTPLDWKIIKAMLWVESGALHREWKVKPMQIGVAGDPGLESFLSGHEGGELIIPALWKGRLTSSKARAHPEDNIRAGTGYLLMRLAKFDHKSVMVPNTEIFEITVESGDSLSKIAKKNGSTLAALQELNPGAVNLKPGQVLKVRKARIQRYIREWRSISTSTIAILYNGGRDPFYARKLDYALNAIKNGVVKRCEI
ncbi:LysM peptidoglycan-binding domain-containing protein [Erwinia amylovora]